MFNRMVATWVLVAAMLAAIPVSIGHSLAESVLVFVSTLGLITLGLIITAIMEMSLPTPSERSIRNRIEASGTCTTIAVFTVGVAIVLGVF